MTSKRELEATLKTVRENVIISQEKASLFEAHLNLVAETLAKQWGVHKEYVTHIPEQRNGGWGYQYVISAYDRFETNQFIEDLKATKTLAVQARRVKVQKALAAVK